MERERDIPIKRRYTRSSMVTAMSIGLGMEVDTLEEVATILVALPRGQRCDWGSRFSYMVVQTQGYLLSG